MRGDRVILDSDKIETFRREHAYGKGKLCKVLLINPATGLKILTGKTITLTTARRISEAMGIHVQSLIESWEVG